MSDQTPNSAQNSKGKKITVPWVRSLKLIQQGNATAKREKLTMLTAYDFPTARLLDSAGIEMLLVGDSLAMVLYGESSTLPVTMEEMLRHTKAVAKGAQNALVIGDMPFLSYQASLEQAVLNGGRFLKEAGANAVKMEGGLEIIPTVEGLVRVGIPVMGHIGLTPQSINALGSYRIHGKTSDEREYLMKSAEALANSGAFAVVLECVEENLASEISNSISIPTIGIGSGPDCDGQVLVTQDLVGLTLGRTPQFVRPLADLKVEMLKAVQNYIARTKDECRKPLQSSKEIHASSH